MSRPIIAVCCAASLGAIFATSCKSSAIRQNEKRKRQSGEWRGQPHHFPFFCLPSQTFVTPISTSTSRVSQTADLAASQRSGPELRSLK